MGYLPQSSTFKSCDFKNSATSPNSGFSEVLATWAVSQVWLSLLVFLIIGVLMVLQRLIEAYGLLEPLSRWLSPLMRLFGLPRQAAYMWLVGNVLGISYGSAVMVELEERGVITRKEANDVNFHLIMNHSMIEDTVVFGATGISPLWLLGTRIAFAIALVWARRLCARARRWMRGHALRGGCL